MYTAGSSRWPSPDDSRGPRVSFPSRTTTTIIIIIIVIIITIITIIVS